MPDTSEQTLALFQKTGAFLEGHFRLTSGLHSPNYLQCALVLQHPQHAEELGGLLATSLREIARESPVDAVVAPAIGGLIIGHEVARALNTRFVFTERDASKNMVLRRGFYLLPGTTAVVVEDVITTGGSSREVVHLLETSGVKVLAAGSIMDRSGGTADLNVVRTALATLSVMSYTEESCPLCREGVPVQKPGSRPS